VNEVREYLASPEGEHLRAILATGMIVSAPFVARLPWMRASRVGRLVGLAGGAALIIKAAEVIRDWDPRPSAS
jgi:hypothetical protein